MATSTAELKSEDLLAALIQNLDQRLFHAERTLAKQLFGSLQEGQSEPIMKLGFSDKSEVLCSLALDKSEYVGNLNFSGFRKHVAAMMVGIKERLEQKAQLNIMRDASGNVLFNIPGIVQSENGINVLVCGLAQNTASEATINLMFLNPSAYEEALKNTTKKG